MLAAHGPCASALERATIMRGPLWSAIRLRGGAAAAAGYVGVEDAAQSAGLVGGGASTDVAWALVAVWVG